jgi:hypothetical protein
VPLGALIGAAVGFLVFVLILVAGLLAVGHFARHHA